MRQLHVGVAQIQAKAARPLENLERMRRQVECAAAVGVEALLFAETVIHGYNFSSENLALAEPLGGPASKQVLLWARQYGMTILAGLLEREGSSLFNTQLVAFPDGHLEFERKHNLTETEKAASLLPGEHRRKLINISGVKCAILICADTGIEGIYKELLEQGAEYCFIPTAGGGSRKDYITLAELGTPAGLERYKENRPRVFKIEAILDSPSAGFPFPGWAAANALGDDGKGTIHQGHCMIVDKQQVLRAQIQGTNVLEHFQDQMVHATVHFP